ncbi:MAG TPA: pyridoxamine 5'-phosphate oxidase family protein [Acidimicrobiales bacterium]|nr:pyridoxamine 5'-phosphate oxidase family protein [Acidimicrobiales bacterium]
MRWADLERDAPRLAERARERLVGPGVLLVGTIRPDGTPRVSPVEPLLLNGDLWLSMMWHSRKAADLQVDDRVLVHSIVTRSDGDEGEIKIRGRAVPVDDPELRLHYCNAVQSLGWRPVEPYFHLFVVDIADTTCIRYAKSGDQHVARWPAGVEFVRRATSPTSVGEPEPVTDLFRKE